jgi:hypothetical protein
MFDNGLVVDHEQVAAALVDPQRPLRNQQGLFADFDRDAQAHEHPRHHRKLPGRASEVLVDRTQQDSARARVQPGGGEIEVPLKGVALRALDAGKHGNDRLPVIHLTARHPHEPDEVAFVQGEVGVDRVHAGDGGEGRGLAGAHEVAGCYQMTVHAAVEGRGHAGVTEVDPGEVQIRPGLDEIGLGRVAFGLPLFHFRFGGGVLLQQGKLPVALLAGAQQLSLGGGQLAFGLLHLGPVGVLFDEEKQIALFDDVPVLEVDAGEETLDARLELNLVHRLGVAGQVDVVGHRLLYRPANGHRRGRRWDELVLLAVACGHGHQHRDAGRSDSAALFFPQGQGFFSQTEIHASRKLRLNSNLQDGLY